MYYDQAYTRTVLMKEDLKKLLSHLDVEELKYLKKQLLQKRKVRQKKLARIKMIRVNDSLSSFLI